MLKVSLSTLQSSMVKFKNCPQNPMVAIKNNAKNTLPAKVTYANDKVVIQNNDPCAFYEVSF